VRHLLASWRAPQFATVFALFAFAACGHPAAPNEPARPAVGAATSPDVAAPNAVSASPNEEGARLPPPDAASVTTPPYSAREAPVLRGRDEPRDPGRPGDAHDALAQKSATDGGSPQRAVGAAPPEECPTKLETEILRRGTCRTAGRTCTFSNPAGSCTCSPTAPAQCGGAEIPHEPSLLTWTCRLASPAHVLRPDGCPLVPPSQGTRCSGTPAACGYANHGACARDFLSATCTRGIWSTTVAHAAALP
jgi:hypothetical protein